VRLIWDLGETEMLLVQRQYEEYRSQQVQYRQSLERRLINLLHFKQAVCEGEIFPQMDPESLVGMEEMEAQLQFLVSDGSERS
jgi:hypothetical protein